MVYTVMIIDDSETIRSVLERTIKLTRLPIVEIVQAVDGMDALAKLNDTWVDIIFTDINMPRMNGIEFIDTVMKKPEFRDIPIIIVSTEGSKTKIEELWKKGIQGYLRKPFTPENIRDIILKTLGGWYEHEHAGSPH